jgi:hypothetical protein
VNYRPILSGKFGKNCNEGNGIPGCHLPLRLAEHSYVQIEEPNGGPKHTWGVLGSPGNKANQEMFEDRTEWDGDPIYPAAGVNSNTVQASDQQAQALEQALTARAGSPFPNCPSCGIGTYHNFFLPPIDVVSFFGAFNSNTFTWNVINNAGLTPPTRIGNLPGYHYSPRYGQYPF